VHLRAEAEDLATQALETAEYKTANGTNPTSGITTSIVNSAGDAFTLSVDYTLTAGTGSQESVCVDPPGQLSTQIWVVQATVSWGVGGQKGQVTDSTLISPAEADLSDANAAEVAVPIYNALDAQYAPGSAVSMTITGTCGLGSGNCGSVPNNEVTTETANSGSTGCVVFTGLYVAADETYAITVSPGTGYIDPDELFYSPGTTGVTYYTAIAPGANEVTIEDDPELVLVKGATATVTFQPTTFSGTTTSAIYASPNMPVSVNSQTLLCAVSGTCVLGNGTSTYGISSGASVVLFPGSTTETTDNYTAWAGDAADSSPNGGEYASTALPTALEVSSGSSVPVGLAVYPLELTINGTVTAMSVVDAAGGDTMTLYGTTNSTTACGTATSPPAAFRTGYVSCTALPLGQFELEATNGSTTRTVSPAYVWITPSGVCDSTTIMSSCSSSSFATLPIKVTIT
jgi:hypothetical protein